MSYKIFKQLSTSSFGKFIKGFTQKSYISKNDSNFHTGTSFTYISALGTLPQQHNKDSMMNKFFPHLKNNSATQSLNIIPNKTENKQHIDLDKIIGYKNYYDYGAIKDEQCNVSAKQFADKPLLERIKASLEIQRGEAVPDISLLMKEMQQTFIQKGHNYDDNDNSHIMQNIGEQVEIDLIH